MNSTIQQDQQKLLDAKIKREAKALRDWCGSCSVCGEIREMLLGKFGPVTLVTLDVARGMFPACYCA